MNTSLEQRMDQRFSRLELAMESMAASVAALPKKKNKKKRAKEGESEKVSKKKKSKSAKGHHGHSSARREEMVSPQPPQAETPAAAPTTVEPKSSNQARDHPPTLSTTAALPHVSNVQLPLSTQDDGVSPTSAFQVNGAEVMTQRNMPALTSSNQGNGVGKQQSWSATVLADGGLTVANNPPLPLSMRDTDNNQDVQERVRQIMQSTATQMSKGTPKVNNFPYEYVRRGDEMKHASVNSVTLAEHIWGIMAMIKDRGISSAIKPALLEHVDEVVEDCMDYEWTAVRRWSEEIFSLAAEGRLPAGWQSTGKIQLLRMSMARTSTARLCLPAARDSQRSKLAMTAGGTANDYWKAGPPCRAYNSKDGCEHQTGHVLNGKRLQHVCSYCFVNAGATFPHSEANCRNRFRDRNHHF